MNNISLLIDFDNNKIIKAFEKIEVESTYTTIDETGIIKYVWVKSMDGDNIEFDLLSSYTEEPEAMCMGCDENFVPMYDDRLVLFDIEPIATCPNCGCKYSETALISPDELKEADEKGGENE